MEFANVPPTRFERVAQRVALTAVFLTLAIVGYLLYLLIWPVRVLEVQRDPAPVISSPIYAGATLVYLLDYCKYQDLPEIVSRELVRLDADQREVRSLILLPMSMQRLPVGCHAIEIEQALPAGMTPGRYTLRSTRLFVVSALQVVYSRTETESFLVLPDLQS